MDAQIGEKAPGLNFVPANLNEADTSVTAFFQAASGDEVGIVCPVTQGQEGKIQVRIQRSVTENLETSEQGIGAYVIVDNADERSTFVTTEPVLEIHDRSFFNETV